MIPLLPAWMLSIGALAYAAVLFRRYKKERNGILLGKFISLVAISIVYYVINAGLFDITTDRAMARWVWLFYILTEIVYNVSREVRERKR